MLYPNSGGFWAGLFEWVEESTRGTGRLGPVDKDDPNRLNREGPISSSPSSLRRLGDRDS